MREQDNERRLTQKCRFTRHIRTRKYDNLLPVGVEVYVVRDIFLARRHHCLNHRMSPLDDVEFHPVVHNRTAVVSFNSEPRESQKDVKPRDDSAVPLNPDDVVANLVNECVIYLRFKYIYLFLRPENLLFILFKFRGYVSFGIDESLFADPFLGHFVFVDIAYFEVVAENGIVVDFKRGYACAFGLTLLNLKKIVLAMTGDASEFVQFGIHPGSNHIALSEHRGCVRVDGPLQRVNQLVATL